MPPNTRYDDLAADLAWPICWLAKWGGHQPQDDLFTLRALTTLRQLKIPPKLGYGARGIGAGAVVVRRWSQSKDNMQGQNGHWVAQSVQIWLNMMGLSDVGINGLPTNYCRNISERNRWFVQYSLRVTIATTTNTVDLPKIALGKWI